MPDFEIRPHRGVAKGLDYNRGPEPTTAANPSTSTDGGGGEGPSVASAIAIDSSWILDYDDPSVSVDITPQLDLAGFVNLGVEVDFASLMLAAIRAVGVQPDLASLALNNATPISADLVGALALDGFNFPTAISVPSYQAVVRFKDSGVTTQPDLVSTDLSGDIDVGTSIAGVVNTTLPASADHYLQRNSGGTNFGGATLLQAKLNLTVVNNDRNAYIEFDTTGFGGGLDVAGAGVLRVRIRHNGAGGNEQTLQYQWRRSSTKPLNENVDTWNNAEPINGDALLQTGSVSTVGTVSDEVITLSEANLQTVLDNGDWLFIKFTGHASNDVQFEINSREATNPPTFEFTANTT